MSVPPPARPRVAGTALALARARKWPLAAGLCLGTALAGRLWGELYLMALVVPTQLRTFACLAAALAATLPLAVRWPPFDRALPRQAAVAPARFLVSYLLFLPTVTVVAAGSVELDFVDGHLMFVVAAVSAWVLAQRWWFPTLVAGIVTMVLGLHDWFWDLKVLVNIDGSVSLALLVTAVLAGVAWRREQPPGPA